MIERLKKYLLVQSDGKLYLKKGDTMKVTIEDEHRVVSIESKGTSEGHISEYVNLVRDAALALSFSEKTVDDYIEFCDEL